MVVTEEHTGKEIKLKSYHYPAYYDDRGAEDQAVANTSQQVAENQNSQQRDQKMDFEEEKTDDQDGHQAKGIVFYVHGFSDYNGRLAHLGQMMSRQGYDYYCID